MNVQGLICARNWFQGFQEVGKIFTFYLHIVGDEFKFIEEEGEKALTIM